MKEVLLVGGGKIGAMITELLANSGDYRVTVADHSAAALAKVAVGDRVEALQLDVTEAAALRDALAGKADLNHDLPRPICRRMA